MIRELRVSELGASATGTKKDLEKRHAIQNQVKSRTY